MTIMQRTLLLLSAVVFFVPVNEAQVREGMIRLAIGPRIWSFGVEIGDPLAELGKIRDLAFGDSGWVFILDPNKSHVVAVSDGGTSVKSFGRPGEGLGEFRNAHALTMDPKGKLLYVLDQALGRISILRWDNNGLAYVSSFETGVDPLSRTVGDLGFKPHVR